MGALLSAATELRELVKELGAARAKHPTDDLVSALVNAEIDGEQLTPDELASFFILLVCRGQRDHPHLPARFTPGRPVP